MADQNTGHGIGVAPTEDELLARAMARAKDISGHYVGDLAGATSAPVMEERALRAAALNAALAVTSANLADTLKAARRFYTFLKGEKS